MRSWLERIAIDGALGWLREHRRDQRSEIAEDRRRAQLRNILRRPR